jgi:hypothetical protein
VPFLSFGLPLLRSDRVAIPRFLFEERAFILPVGEITH